MVHVKNNIKEFIKSKSFQAIIAGVVVMIIALVIFQAGMFVGYRKAAFAFKFGDNYYRAFDERREDSRSFHMPMRGGFIDAHGVAGKIISINLPTLVVSGPDEPEKVVNIGSDTVIRRFDKEITSSDLKIDDLVVVIGAPNDDSQIEAKLIRVLPPPPDAMEKNAEIMMQFGK